MFSAITRAFDKKTFMGVQVYKISKLMRFLQQNICGFFIEWKRNPLREFSSV